MHTHTVVGFVLVLLGVLACGPCFGETEAEKKQAAQDAATSWLALVDQGKYGESWEQAAEYFKNAVSKEDWIQAVTAAREPLGAMQSRSVKNSRLAETLPGAPDGLYCLFQFSTSFANKKQAVETVTPMVDTDGTWRVSGYYIK
jgi:hypothetical protein